MELNIVGKEKIDVTGTITVTFNVKDKLPKIWGRLGIKDYVLENWSEYEVDDVVVELDPLNVED